MDAVHHRAVATAHLAQGLLAVRAALVSTLISSNKPHAFHTSPIHHRSVAIPTMTTKRIQEKSKLLHWLMDDWRWCKHVLSSCEFDYWLLIVIRLLIWFLMRYVHIHMCVLLHIWREFDLTRRQIEKRWEEKIRVKPE